MLTRSTKAWTIATNDWSLSASLRTQRNAQEALLRDIPDSSECITITILAFNACTISPVSLISLPCLTHLISFLITPKLLPNLTAMEEEAMTILFVMNGPHNFRSPTQWSVDEIVGESASTQKRNQITGEDSEEENSGNTSGDRARRSNKKARPSIEE